MEKLHIEFENCYGIRKLSCIFDFTEKPTYAIYSPNGTMKTSFAKAFMDLSENQESKDLIFTDRDTVRKITDNADNDLSPEQIFVVEPYNQTYKSNKLSTLLVNKELKEKYDLIHANIDEKKDVLFKELKPLTGIKKNIEEILSEAFTHSPKEFYRTLLRVKAEVLDSSDPEYSDIVYNKIYIDKVISFLNTKDFKEKLEQYIEKYDELIDSSTYFKKGIFNHNNASVIAKNLKDNGFFKAKHSVYLNSEGEKKEITTQDELEEVIEQEKVSILNNPELASAFNELDTKLKANKELRDFRDYLLENKKLLPELPNLELFKQKLWVSYLKTTKEAYVALEKEYTDGKDEIESIIQEAKKEETDWRHVIEIFNNRFSVPFSLLVENQEDVILKSDAPNIKFSFNEANNTKSVAEHELVSILSNGEKRALYILNIIFEVEARKKNGQETLFIIDDIADSFDYKNKYAIIEYLKDISLYDGFYQILLSHNFDFFRTVCSRLDMLRKHKLHTIKTEDQILLIEEKYQNNPFNHWRDNLSNGGAMLIASIPFVRNIAEYIGDDENYNKLTSLLHIKEDTHTISIADLESIHKAILANQGDFNIQDKDKTVLNYIFEEADTISQTNEETPDLEGKIVLAIAIRLIAEEHMISNINDSDFVASITKTQTFKLYEKYLEMYPGNTVEIKILDQVNLMTPENIHINSFMYEPILDMSNHALISLYNNVKSTLSTH